MESEVVEVVQELKREVELLKTLLHEERKKSASATVSSSATQNTLVFPVDPFSRAATSTAITPSAPLDDDAKATYDHSPRRAIAASGAADARGRSMRGNTTGAGQQLWNVSYLEQAPVDTKRGKWWLKERQILSRNVPSTVDGCTAIKVREVWLWSGRTVAVDKIVTCPTLHDDDHHAFDSDEESHRQATYGDKSATGATPFSPASSGRLSPRTSIAPASAKYSDAKQLAQEFLLPKATSPAAISTAHSKDSLDTASARMEKQMSHAAAQQGHDDAAAGGITTDKETTPRATGLALPLVEE